MNWKYTKIPKDRAIIRWHKIWNCPIAVKYNTEDFVFTWVEKTLAQQWPDAAFRGDVWAEIPKEPLTKSGKIKRDKEVDARLKNLDPIIFPDKLFDKD